MRGRGKNQSLLRAACGKEPRMVSFSQWPARAVNVRLILGSSAWPSKSTKKTYSVLADRDGNDSIQVRFTLFWLNTFRASTRAPGLCGTLNISDVLSLPVR